MATSSDAISGPIHIQQKPKRVAGIIIGGHGFQHMYADGFLVLLPFVYEAFGLTAITTSLIAVIRQSAAGALSMGGGFVIDMFSGKRGLLLAGSLFTMGLGYLLVAAAPNYTLLLIAIALGSAAGSFWHPVGLGILSYTFPQNRAFVISLHRSSGNVGESITPLVVGLVVAVLTWRQVLLSAFLLIAVVATALYIFLGRIGLQDRVSEKRSIGEQFRTMGQLFQSRTLPLLLMVAALRGMADRALLFFLAFFVYQALREADPNATLAESSAITGLYLTLLAVPGIIAMPFLGALSDRIGRRPVIISVLAMSTALMLLLWNFSTISVTFSLLLVALGAIRFATNNLTQAASLDVADGKRLEGSMIGLLWGNNALFGAFSPLLLSFLITEFSLPDGSENYRVIFPYAAVLYAIATVASLSLPAIGGRRGAPARPT